VDEGGGAFWIIGTDEVAPGLRRGRGKSSEGYALLDEKGIKKSRGKEIGGKRNAEDGNDGAIPRALTRGEISHIQAVPKGGTGGNYWIPN